MNINNNDNNLQNQFIFTNDVVNEIDDYVMRNADTMETLNSDFARESLNNFARVLYTPTYEKERLLRMDIEDIGIDVNYSPKTRLEWYVYVYNTVSKYLDSHLTRNETLIKNVRKQREMQNVSFLDDFFGPHSRAPRLARRAHYLQSFYSRKILDTLKYLFRNTEYIEMKNNLSLAQNEYIDLNFNSMGNSIVVRRISDFLETGVSEVAKTINKYSNIIARKNDFDAMLMFETGDIFEGIFGTTNLDDLEAVSDRYINLYDKYLYLERVLPKEFKDSYENDQFKKFKDTVRDLHTFTTQFMVYKILIQTPYKITAEQIRNLGFRDNIFGNELSKNKILPLRIFYDETFNENIKLLREILEKDIDTY